MGHRYSTAVKTIQDNALVIRDFTSLSYDGLISELNEITQICHFIERVVSVSIV